MANLHPPRHATAALARLSAFARIASFELLVLAFCAGVIVGLLIFGHYNPVDSAKDNSTEKPALSDPISDPVRARTPTITATRAGKPQPWPSAPLTPRGTTVARPVTPNKSLTAPPTATRTGTSAPAVRTRTPTGR